MSSIASNPLELETNEATNELAWVGSVSTHRREFLSASNVPKLATPMNEYLDQTPCSADSRRKLPLESPASFSKTDKGVSLPEKSVETIGITRYLRESKTASSNEINGCTECHQRRPVQ
jgi:hypothetical protein